MPVLLLSLLALGIVAFVAGWIRQKALRRRLKRGEISEMPAITQGRPAGCCGKHAVCERASLLAAASVEPEYYDDEELDRYKGRPADGYTAEEVEEFEEVLTTMREDEVAGWIRSLQLRGIALPEDLRDEVILIVGEQRFGVE